MKKIGVMLGSVAALISCLCMPKAAFAQAIGSPGIVTRVSHAPQSSISLQARSWYGTRFSFASTYSTGSYSFDGNSVGIEMNCSATGGGVFSVSLVNASTGHIVGSATFQRNGFNKADWTNVGPGRYRFMFSKAADGVVVSCSNVAMFSW